MGDAFHLEETKNASESGMLDLRCGALFVISVSNYSSKICMVSTVLACEMSFCTAW